MNVKWYERFYLHVIYPELNRYIITEWRWRLSIWFIDTGVALGNWISPGED
jgi:hypothetical protein